MPDSISRETREQLEALCRKISVSYDQDPEIRKELYGHMEDRLLAHMNGEIPLTEQDAFILVREHFGDPAAVKESFQGVHLEQAALSMGRRLAAALVACIAANLLRTFLLLSPELVPESLGAWRAPVQMVLFTLIEAVLFPLMMYHILSLWKRRMDAGERVWLQAMPAWGVAAVLVAAIMLSSAGGSFYAYLQLFISNPFITTGVGLLIIPTSLASMVVLGAIWIWFCDQPPRTRQSLHLAVGVWAIILLAVVRLSVSIGNPPEHQLLVSVGESLIASIILAMVSLGLYRFATWFRREPLHQ